MINARTKRWIWLIWIMFWPTTMILLFTFFRPNLNDNLFDIVALGALMIVAALFYFQVRGTDIMVLQGISLAVFLLFGLFVEVLLIQVAILIYLLVKRIPFQDAHRYPVNLLMFLFVSVTSGGFYYLLGGQTGSLSTGEMPDFLAIFGYTFMMFLSNHVFLYSFRRIVLKSGRFLGKDLFWEAITTAIYMPVGIVLYSLYSVMGTSAIFFIAIPAITLSVIFRLVNSSYEINFLLQKTSEVGQQLTEKLDVRHIIDLLFELLSSMLNIDFAYIMDSEKGGPLQVIRLFENEPGTLPKRDFTHEAGISWQVSQLGKSYRCATRKQWRHMSKGFLPMSVQSVISVPMKRNQKTVGVLTIASKTKRVYGKQHLMVVEILANFLAVAIDNARNYEKTKNQSERDPLTNLYNYRYFTNILEKSFEKTLNQSPFSIIMLDLDHFKKVNDTYGHESGNSVLCQMANRLNDIIGDNGTIARYGGEEFIILLPEMDKHHGFEVAEDLRQRISNEPFLIEQPNGLQRRQLIHVTASIGVATAPIQGEDPMSLIRNADRAMYSGAKKNGRNRVATYVG